MAKTDQFTIKQSHQRTSKELASLNREMAMQMIMLASQTGDIEPLIGAVKALRSTEELYNQDTTPIENAYIQKKLGDVLLSVGKDELDQRALEHAILAYRSAITISSLLGAEGLRSEIRKKYELAMQYAGRSDASISTSLVGAA